VVNTKINSNDPFGTAKGIFYLMTVALILSARAVVAQPKLVIKEPKVNFGMVSRGEVLRHTFTITNAGTEPLILSGTDVECSCTEAELPKQPVMPGAEAFIKLTFNTLSVYGRQDRVVQVHSNDPRSPSRFRFKAMVSKK
jgi:hypothetical protein